MFFLTLNLVFFLNHRPNLLSRCCTCSLVSLTISFMACNGCRKSWITLYKKMSALGSYSGPWLDGSLSLCNLLRDNSLPLVRSNLFFCEVLMGTFFSSSMRIGEGGFLSCNVEIICGCTYSMGLIWCDSISELLVSTWSTVMHCSLSYLTSSIVGWYLWRGTIASICEGLEGSFDGWATLVLTSYAPLLYKFKVMVCEGYLDS